jgi:hypothetical protein
MEFGFAGGRDGNEYIPIFFSRKDSLVTFVSCQVWPFMASALIRVKPSDLYLTGPDARLVEQPRL